MPDSSLEDEEREVQHRDFPATASLPPAAPAVVEEGVWRGECQGHGGFLSGQWMSVFKISLALFLQEKGQEITKNLTVWFYKQCFKHSPFLFSRFSYKFT
jgi:hypothetical protein